MNFLKPYNFFGGVDFIFLELFLVHSKIEKKVQRFPECLPPHHQHPLWTGQLSPLRT